MRGCVVAALAALRKHAVGAAPARHPGRRSIPGRAFPLRSGLAGAACVATLVACSETGGEPQTPIERGRAVYQSVCLACHHSNPAQAGSLGPDVAGASRELLEAKLLRGEYPPGYTPKRDSNAMPRFPHLAGDLDALAAYLSSVPNGP